MIHEFTRNIAANPYRDEYCWAPGFAKKLNRIPATGSRIFDRESIMMYPFRKCNFREEYQNCEFINTRITSWLSPIDEQCLKNMYPSIDIATNELFKYKNNHNRRRLISTLNIFLAVLIAIVVICIILKMFI
jgi:hypothetical protein